MKQIIRRITALLCSAAVAISAAVVTGAENVPEKPTRTYPTGGLIKGECTYITPEEADRIDEHVRADYENSPVSNAFTMPALNSYNHSTDYFYDQLSASGKELYDNLDAVCKAFATSSVTVTPAENGAYYMSEGIEFDPALFQSSVFTQVSYAFYYSHPEYYFFTNGGNFTYLFGGEYGVYGCRFYPEIIGQFADPQQRRAYQSVINTVTDNVMAKAESVSEPLEQELMICKYLADTIVYKLKPDGTPDGEANAQTIAGALVDKTCVCNGYAMAVSYFLNALGIDTLVVVGENHAWNLAQLYGNWYELDITWADDEDNEMEMGWINKSHATILKQDPSGAHIYDPSVYSVYAIPESLYDTVIKAGTATLTSVVLTPPAKSGYFKGEALDLSGGHLLLTYSDGYEETIDLEESMVTGFDSSETGARTLTVTYGDFSADFGITITDKPAAAVAGISVTPPAKTEYLRGEKLDVTGGIVTVTYTDSTAADIALTLPMISGYNSAKAGEQELTVSYEGFSASFTVTVKLVSGSVLVDENNFPDPVFREYVLSRIDLNKDGALSAYEMSSVGSMYLGSAVDYEGEKIKDLTGIGYFTGLKDLECQFNEITDLDVSANTELERLDCSYNKLVTLNVTGCTKLGTLYCQVNELGELDVSSCKKLTDLSCRGNKLTALDVTNNILLDTLNIGELIEYTNDGTPVYSTNFIRRLDLSNNHLLTFLWCDGNLLTELDITNNPGIHSLSINGNPLTSLDLSHSYYLQGLFCSYTNIACFDVSNTGLYYGSVGDNYYNIGDVVGSFSLLSIEGFDPDKASEWYGARYNSKTKSLTNFTSDIVYYKYDIGLGGSAPDNYFALKVNSYRARENKSVTKTELVSLPKKTDYTQGEALEIAGGKIKVTYSDGTDAQIALSASMVTGFDSTMPGLQTLTVTYGGQTAEFDVNVTPAGVKINYENFPDDLFREYVSENFDTNSDGVLSDDEIENAAVIDFGNDDNYTGEKVSSYDGIWYLTSLTKIIIYNNLDTGGYGYYLDLTDNPKVTYLDCGCTDIYAVDISKCTELRVFSCEHAYLYYADFSCNPALKYIDVSSNNLSELDVSMCTELEYLYCEQNHIKTLETGTLIHLEGLDCYNNMLEKLDLTGFTALEILNCSDNAITELTLTGCESLASLTCFWNELTSLVITDSPLLYGVSVQGNRLTVLDIGNCPDIEYLYADSNELTALDVSACTKLIELACPENCLTELDVTNNTGLTTLVVSGNYLEALDVSKNTKLKKLCIGETFDNGNYVLGNSITQLDLSNNPLITDLKCSNNCLTSLDLSGLTLTAADVSDNVFGIGSVTEFELSELPGFDPAKASGWNGADYDSTEQKLTNITGNVTYTYDLGNGSTAQFTLAVGEAKLVAAIEITPPAKLSYLKGEEIDLTGGTVTIYYNDRTEETIDLTADMISGFDSSKAPRRVRVTVSCGGREATFEVRIVEKNPAAITITPPERKFFSVDEELDLTGGTMTVTYSDDTTDTFLLEAGTTSGYDSTKPGTQTVTVTYEGCTDTFEVTVIRDLDKLPVVVNGNAYETLAKALTANKNGDLDITICKSITEKSVTIPKTVTSATISTAPDVVLTLSTPTITANCDLVLDAAVEAEKANAKTLTIKTIADKTVTIKWLETTLPLTLNGTKTSDFVLDTGSCLGVASAAAVNVEIGTNTTVVLNKGKFTPAKLSGDGVLIVYDASTVTIADAEEACIILYQYRKVSGKNVSVLLPKLTVGTIGSMIIAVADPDGNPANISGQTVITLSKQDTIPNLENKITIVNTANGKPLSAVQYKKEIRAEWLDAITVSTDNSSENYSSFEKAVEAMTDTTAEYTVLLNEDTSLSKLTLPKAVGALTIDGQGHTLTLVGVTSISPKYTFGVADVDIVCVSKTGADAALTIGSSAGSFAATDVGFTGANLTLNCPKGTAVIMNVTAEGKAFNIKGGSSNYLMLYGGCSEITSLTGFSYSFISGEVKIGTTFTANDAELSSTANLTIGSGATFTVNRNKSVTAEDGAKITLIKGFKPIVLNGTIASNVKFVSDVTLEDQQIFKTKENLSGKYDLSGIAPGNSPESNLTYDLLTSGGYAYLKAYTIDVNGTKYAFWADAIAAMKDRNTDYTITLLADVEIGAALKLPTAAKCRSLTIDGNGHKLTFVGNAVTLSIPTTLKDITLTATKLNSKTKVYETVKWTLKNSSRLTEEGTVVLTNCEKK